MLLIICGLTGFLSFLLALVFIGPMDKNIPLVVRKEEQRGTPKLPWSIQLLWFGIPNFIVATVTAIIMRG
ncbi:hypothetical protein [Metabacillus iocasae]|uniref:Uncharacterized protein n=1 Tax=Priestia iocasae TaxID=2291674 RepID=A0ABS2QWH2_9BACI|nr:hypothetical protein [Metabacillus iocasae]MBM7703826.1 hypothetical protein [Metabacillus iocasae]